MQCGGDADPIHKQPYELNYLKQRIILVNIISFVFSDVNDIKR